MEKNESSPEKYRALSDDVKSIYLMLWGDRGIAVRYEMGEKE